MSILTKSAIKEAIEKGDIEIDPMPDDIAFGANSVDLRIDNAYCKLQYSSNYGKINYEHTFFEHPKLMPSPVLSHPPTPELVYHYYLASTIERIHCKKHIPIIETRSSAARMGITAHFSAGFGDIGFDNNFTLEIKVEVPVSIKPGQRLVQVYFIEPSGEIDHLYKGHYNKEPGIMLSKGLE